MGTLEERIKKIELDFIKSKIAEMIIYSLLATLLMCLCYELMHQTNVEISQISLLARKILSTIVFILYAFSIGDVVSIILAIKWYRNKDYNKYKKYKR